MRVPVYQQQVTPQIPSVRSQVGVPDGAAGVAVKPIDTTTGIAQGVESLRLGLVKLNENRKKFMLASAVNDYRRQNTEFLHAKDTGIFAKKGKNVFGATQQYDEFSSKAMEDIAKRYKMSGVARDRFVEATSALYNASLSSVMTHEQRETDAAQQMEWKTMINDSLNAVALSYNDDAVCEENWRIMAGAIVQQNEQYGDQVVQSKLAEARSQLQIARLAPMLEDNPKAADAFLKAHKSEFTSTDLLKAQKAVDNKLDVIKVQETTDVLAQKFRGNEQAALRYIHKNYEGDMENHLVSSVKARFGEMEIRSHGAATAAARQENALAKVLRQEVDNGTYFSPDQLIARGVPQRVITNVLAYQDGKRRWNKAEDDLRRSIGNDAFINMPAEEREIRVLDKLGTSNESRKANRAALLRDCMAGRVTSKTVKDAAVHGLITPIDSENIIETAKNFSAEQKQYVRQETSRFNSILKDLLKKFPNLDERYANEIYTQAVAGIPANDPKHHEKVYKAGQQALVDMINIAFKNKTYTRGASFLGWEVPYTSSALTKQWFDLQKGRYSGSENTYKAPAGWGDVPQQAPQKVDDPQKEAETRRKSDAARELADAAKNLKGKKDPGEKEG